MLEEFGTQILRRCSHCKKPIKHPNPKGYNFIHRQNGLDSISKTYNHHNYYVCGECMETFLRYSGVKVGEDFIRMGK
jgi:NAD-dependent dihydropyrimidine dehydrogenase PreA subunit